MSDFKARYGSWAVVAGASEGLGVAFAERLAARGMNILLIARRGELLNKVADDLRQAHGVEVRCLVQDLAAPNLSEALAEATSDLDLGVLIYNAAFVPMGPFIDAEEEDIQQLMRVNTLGLVASVRTLVPGMRERGRGGVILVSSLAGLQGFPGIAGYSATKSFIINLGEALWYELKPHGIDAMACIAGAMPTPGYTKVFKELAPGTLSPEDAAERTLKALGKGPRFIPGFINTLVAGTTQYLMSRKRLIPFLARTVQDLDT